MYGDTTVIRGLARQLRDQGADIRTEADALVGQADAVHWSGLAADAMRRLARDHGSDLRSCAGRHDDAAEALERHAREVDRLKDLISGIEHRFVHLLDGARDRLAGFAHSLTGGLRHVLPDGLDDWLDRFVPPPSGSKDWLDVHVPGL
jgi:hypothetical protein